MSKERPLREKVFGIGLPRTGTTSLAVALLQMGFKTAHCVYDDEIFELGDAFTDTPVFADWRELDVRYPGSKFVLTVRPFEQWIRSVRRLSDYLARLRGSSGRTGKDQTNLRCWLKIFGRLDIDDAHYRAQSERHVREVRAWFADRKEDLLEVDITSDSEAMRKVAEFVGRVAEARTFPHANIKVGDDWARINSPLKVPSSFSGRIAVVDNFIANESRKLRFSPEVVFDVGANVGQTVGSVLERWEAARVYAFEPAVASFFELEKKFGMDRRVVLNRVALDSSPGRVRFKSDGTSTGNRILSGGESGNSEVVETTCGDIYCREQGIPRIDFLKIDAEGFDLDVLTGFAGMLRDGCIQFIQVESTTNLDNRFHVHLERFIHFLHPFNYRVYGLFDFKRKCFGTNQRLNGAWFCNAVFVREVIDPILRKDGRN